MLSLVIVMRPYIKAEKNHTDRPDPTVFRHHTHEEYEILCFIAGDAEYVVEGNVYRLKPNDVIITKRAEAHALRIHTIIPYTRYVIDFNADALLGTYADSLPAVLDSKPLGRFNRISPNDLTQQEQWLSYIDRIVFAATTEEQQLYLTVLMAELCHNLGRRSSEHEHDTNQLIDYINHHLLEVRSLDELCQTFHISKTHLNRKFKAMTGSTAWDYIVTKRLITAKDLLSQGEKPNDVSERCGYEDYSAFYRAYKQHFGVSPKVDRQK